MLGGFTLASWGALRTLGSTGKDTWRSRLGFVLIFLGFRDPILKAFWVPWTKKGVFVHACFQVSFSADFWVCIWMSGIGKPSFRRNFISHDSWLGCIFHDFPWDKFL